jgi:hypothetical protein
MQCILCARFSYESELSSFVIFGAKILHEKHVRTVDEIDPWQNQSNYFYSHNDLSKSVNRISNIGIYSFRAVFTHG